MSWLRPVASTAVKRIAAPAALSAALAAGGYLIPHLEQEEALGDGKGRLVYVDPVGVTTWCYGDTGPVPNTPLNQAVCEAQLNKRVKEECLPVAQAIKVPVYVHEMAAICSWAYNIGWPSAANSTAIKRLNACDYDRVPEAMLWFKYAQGRDCTIRSNDCYGMWLRRLKGADMCRGMYAPV